MSEIIQGFRLGSELWTWTDVEDYIGFLGAAARDVRAEDHDPKARARRRADLHIERLERDVDEILNRIEDHVTRRRAAPPERATRWAPGVTLDRASAAAMYRMVSGLARTSGAHPREVIAQLAASNPAAWGRVTR